MAGADRKSHFPSIEKKHGMPMSHWFAQMEKVAGKKYPEQIAFLRENHGFSQAHANALVMFTRGSKSSKRFNTLEEYLKPFDAQKKKTVKAIFKAIQSKYPKMELVIAWNQPMLKLGDDYIFGLSVLKNHILMAPWSKDVLDQFQDRLEDYKVNKKTIALPNDWQVDVKLLQAMMKDSLAAL
jgi:uncharacterized protein YdhG (YjbR/CyaY superfamily)